MFTGIIECLATVKKVEKEKGNLNLSLESSVTKELKIDQSLCHNGVCLTVVNTNDEEYLKVLRETIPKVIDQFEPEFIFYLSGVDVLENDKLGRLSLTINGCKERDRFILEICKNNSIPVQVSMGGGYSVILKNIIEAHSNTFRLAQEIFFW